MTTPQTQVVNPQSLNNSPEEIANALALHSTQVVADLTAMLGWKARMVATQLPAYGGTGTATLTATATGLMGAMDGVTPALNDIILVPAGIANVTAADSGLWQVTTLGAVGVKWVLQRPAWYALAAVAQFGQKMDVGPEGALFANSEWVVMTKGSVIGTTDAGWYPRRVIQQVALGAGGVVAITNVPIFSATKSMVHATMAAVGGTMTGVVGFQPLTITPGALGTASVTVTAVSTAQATTGNGPTPLLNIAIFN